MYDGHENTGECVHVESNGSTVEPTKACLVAEVECLNLPADVMHSTGDKCVPPDTMSKDTDAEIELYIDEAETKLELVGKQSGVRQIGLEHSYGNDELDAGEKLHVNLQNFAKPQDDRSQKPIRLNIRRRRQPYKLQLVPEQNFSYDSMSTLYQDFVNTENDQHVGDTDEESTSLNSIAVDKFDTEVEVLPHFNDPPDVEHTLCETSNDCPETNIMVHCEKVCSVVDFVKLVTDADYLCHLLIVHRHVWIYSHQTSQIVNLCR